MEVSERQLREDVKVINRYLDYDEDVIEIKNGYITIDSEFKSVILLEGLTFENYYVNKNERITCELFILLHSDDYISTNEISETLYVSRSTVLKDLETIGAEAEKFNLDFLSHQGKGLLIETKDERNIRNLFINLIINNYYLYRVYINSCLINYSDEWKHYHKIIVDVLRNYESTYSLSFSDIEFNIIAIYLSYQAYRVGNGNVVEGESFIPSDGFAGELMKEIYSHLPISYNEDESNYFGKLLNQLNFQKFIVNSGFLKDDFLAIDFLTSKFILEISRELRLPLNLDYKLYESLSTHLNRINQEKIIRISDYPDLLSVVESNESVYQAVIKFKPTLNKIFDRDITDEEIFYVVIYIIASIERLIKVSKKNINILLISNLGQGPDQLIKTKLEDLTGIEVKDLISTHNIANKNLKNTDLIVSTSPLREIEHYIKITPAINNEEIIYINDAINDKSIELLHQLYSENNRAHIIATDIDDYGIEFYLKQSSIKVDVEANSWQEAIEVAGELLVANKNVTEGYIKDVKDNIKKSGPYFILNNSLAIPHAKVSEDVMTNGYSFVRLVNPVTFGDNNSEVKYILMLSATGDKKHLKALFEFTNLWEYDAFRDEVELAKSPKELELIIENYKDILLNNKYKGESYVN